MIQNLTIVQLRNLLQEGEGVMLAIEVNPEALPEKNGVVQVALFCHSAKWLS